MRLIIAFLGGSAAKTTTACEACKELRDGIEKNLEKTRKQNFGGGNSNWEESRLGPWATSDTRMLHAIEHACKGDFKCSSFLEEYEDEVEEWFKSGPDTGPVDERLDFHTEICVNLSKSCCLDKDSFGKDCKSCPMGFNLETCSGRGKCEGAGDRKGKGSCKCDHGYTGDHCDKCAEEYFMEKEISMTEKPSCERCLHKCKGCQGEKGRCIQCRDDYEQDGDTNDDGTFNCRRIPKPTPEPIEEDEDDAFVLEAFAEVSSDETTDPPTVVPTTAEITTPESTTPEATTPEPTTPEPTADPRFAKSAFDLPHDEF